MQEVWCSKLETKLFKSKFKKYKIKVHYLYLHFSKIDGVNNNR